MRYNSVLLISPLYEKSHFYGGRSVTPPIGLGYLAETLESDGVRVKAVDMGLEHPLKDVLSIIAGEKIDLIGVSIISYRYRPIYRMIDEIKKTFPEIPIIAGGAHMISFRGKVLEDCSSIDYGVIGQGEAAMSELVKGAAIDSIDGLVHRKNGVVVENKPRKFIENLDSIPFPRYRSFEMEKYGRTIPLISSRGCPSQCIYCQKTTGDRAYFRSPDNVADEISHWYKLGFRDFSFHDDNFTFINKRAGQICQNIIDRGMNDAVYSAQGVRADRVDSDLLLKMKEAGFKHVSFGVEAGNDRMLKVLKKGLTLKTIDIAVKIATDMSFSVQLYFIIGSPYETINDVKDSFEFALKYPVSKVIFTNMIPYPGTELFFWIKEHSRFYMNPEDYLDNTGPYENRAIFDSLGMTCRERAGALRRSRRIVRKVFAKGMKKRILCRYKLSAPLAEVCAQLLSCRVLYNLATSRPIAYVMPALKGVIKKT